MSTKIKQEYLSNNFRPEFGKKIMKFLKKNSDSIFKNLLMTLHNNDTIRYKHYTNISKFYIIALESFSDLYRLLLCTIKSYIIELLTFHFDACHF